MPTIARWQSTITLTIKSYRHVYSLDTRTAAVAGRRETLTDTITHAWVADPKENAQAVQNADLEKWRDW